MEVLYMFKWKDLLEENCNIKKINKVEKHKQICEKLNSIYKAKNDDYGDSFSEMYKKLGIISLITRIGDKYYRLANLCIKSEEDRKVKDENIKDTLMDLANYAIMTLIELDKE